jgi:hypothetical protein
VVFTAFIMDDFIPELRSWSSRVRFCIPSWRCSLGYRASEQTLEREQNESDVLEALGEYKSDAGMSFENVPAVVNIKTLKGRFIAHKFCTGWAVGVEKSGKEEMCCWPVCSQV